MSAELLAPGLIIGAAFESAYPVAKGNYYDIEARIWPTHRCTCACTCCMHMHMHTWHVHAHGHVLFYFHLYV